MAFYVYKVASGVIKLVVIARSFGEESLLFSHVFPLLHLVLSTCDIRWEV